MLKRKGLKSFAYAKDLKAALVEMQKECGNIDIQSIIICLDCFLSLEEKVKNMNRAEITKKVEQKMLERGKEINQGIALLTGQTKGMPTQLADLKKKFEENISA
jgi:hypothetical protein